MSGAYGRKNRCESCSAELLWARTRDGKNMPLDAAPDQSTGRWVLRGVPARAIQLPYGPELQAAMKAGEPLYVTHWVTCPNSNGWKGRGKPPRRTDPPKTKPEKEGLF